MLLLHLNRGDSMWGRASGGEFRTNYRTEDDKLHAVVIPVMFGRVRIETIENYQKRVADLKPQAILEAIKGFSSEERSRD